MNAGTYETYDIVHGKLCSLLAGSSYHSFNHPDHGKGSYQPVVADAKLELGFSNDFVDKSHIYHISEKATMFKALCLI